MYADIMALNRAANVYDYYLNIFMSYSNKTEFVVETANIILAQIVFIF